MLERSAQLANVNMEAGESSCIRRCGGRSGESKRLEREQCRPGLGKVAWRCDLGTQVRPRLLPRCGSSPWEGTRLCCGRRKSCNASLGTRAACNHPAPVHPAAGLSGLAVVVSSPNSAAHP
jgi:hypothetical protein